MKSILVRFIIFTNIAVFLLWILLGRFQPSSAFMDHNFLVSWSGLISGRPWILVTSVFSHNLLWHLVLNMYVLHSFGPIMETALGSRRFLKFYLTAGIISSLSHALISAFVMRQPELQALGASGAISGVILLFSFMFPQQIILIFGFIPIPAVLGALLIVGLDLWGLAVQVGGGASIIGHGAHLGGALTGVIYYLLYLRPRFSERHSERAQRSFKKKRSPNRVGLP